MVFVREHLDKFKQLGPTTESWKVDVKNYLTAFFSNKSDSIINIDVKANSIPSGYLGRSEIFNFIENISDDLLLNTYVILAWGKMRHANLAQLVTSEDIWFPLVKRIHTNKLDREDSYQEFIFLLSNGMKGMRAPYFTKLIYFLTRNSSKRGFILDQWTGRSMNLLLGYDLIKLDKGQSGKYVNNFNTVEIYEKYCINLELLGEELSLEPEEVELRLFSTGRGKGEWRNYVKLHT